MGAKATIIGVMASAANGVVGNKNSIPWYYPDEFQHFRNIIGNDPIILGRKTFELIPESILKNRTVIVFSRIKKQHGKQEMLKQVQHDDKNKKRHPEQNTTSS